ncbi:hypothetical protein MVEN_00071900 [Mycena venus]|uniref:Uncharacterized protein n=1 Tax=Mycena venus TaxID=2733690 RepID=A0A8H7DF68_9AGAR|nr:hypothetical protein MVEN_00071900 [Mycena venus]
MYKHPLNSIKQGWLQDREADIVIQRDQIITLTEKNAGLRRENTALADYAQEMATEMQKIQDRIRKPDVDLTQSLPVDGGSPTALANCAQEIAIETRDQVTKDAQWNAQISGRPRRRFWM